MNRLFESLKNTADGAFVIDENLRIVYWNKAAESILGLSSEEATGHFCFKLLQGYGDDNQLICNAKCQVAHLAFVDKPVSNYDLRVTKKKGNKHWINMSVFCYKLNNGNQVIVHLFRNLKQIIIDTSFLSYKLEIANNFRVLSPEDAGNKDTSMDKLTPREQEVLMLLVEGNGTNEIANLLSISPNTVRNHLQSIFQKFRVHSRLEAVTHAIKNNLV